MSRLVLLLAAYVTVVAGLHSPTSRLRTRLRSPSQNPHLHNAPVEHTFGAGVAQRNSHPPTRRATGPYHAELIWTNTGASPAFHVHLGGDFFTAVWFDLGSSMFWVPDHDWHCVDNIYKNLTTIPRHQCANPTSTTSSNFAFSGGQIPDAGFNSTYNGGAQGVAGILGHQKVKVGDLTVPDVIVGLSTQVQQQYSYGGVMGFGFPFRTAQWSRSELKHVGQIQRLTKIGHYDPFIFQAAADGLISPVFGYYFDDMGNPDGTRCGEVTFGGEPRIPSLPFSHDVPVVPLADGEQVVFDSWSIHLDGFKIVPKPGASPLSFSYLQDDKSQMLVQGSKYLQHTAAVDTGTPDTAVPSDVYHALLKYINPAPKKNQDGSMATSCDATVPEFAVTIGGTDLWFNRSGILYPPKYNPSEQTCELGISPADGYSPILGATFLINAVAVHNFKDLAAPTVKFAQRVWS